MTHAPLLELLLYLSLASLIVVGMLVIVWVVTRERGREGTIHEDREEP